MIIITAICQDLLCAKLCSVLRRYAIHYLTKFQPQYKKGGGGGCVIIFIL